MFTTKFRADDQGRFTINPYAGDYFRMRAFPPEGQPYLVREHEFEWTKGAVRKEVDLKLPRGVLIHGKVTEKGTGRPVAGASVQFVPMKPPATSSTGWKRSCQQGRRLVPDRRAAGQGTPVHPGPTLDFIPEEIGGGKLYASGQPGGLATLRPRHHPLRRQGRQNRPRHLRRPEPGQDSARPSRSARRARRSRMRVILTRQQLEPQNLTWLTHHLHPRPRRPVRAAWLRPGETLAGLLPRRRARVGRRGRGLRQAGRRGADHPPRALRPGQGTIRRARRQAGREA